MLKRRTTRVVKVGQVAIGGEHPIAIQSMVTANTMDTAAVVAEVKALVAVGCPIVRITAPTVAAAKNLKNIREALTGVEVALVADIHFQAAAALEAALHVEKVRINPGNFCETRDCDREGTFRALLDICKQRGVALRIGTNHGSLSERMMSAYGDTPRGMVESALEYLRMARDYEFNDIIISMKASNPKVMIAAYRSLVAALDEEGMEYPLHLGVTEAGDGEDGRIKSAIGIGSLLGDGIGDTIRVSLTEDAVCEIPVARELLADVEQINTRVEEPSLWPLQFEKRISREVKVGPIALGGSNPVCVGVRGAFAQQNPDAPIELVFENDVAHAAELPAASLPLLRWCEGLDLTGFEGALLVAARSIHDLRHAAAAAGDLPLVIEPLGGSKLANAVIAGAALCDGLGDALLIDGSEGEAAAAEAYTILQSAGTRLTRTDFIACPSCGRTLFNLQETTAKVKAATSHLKGIKIAIMGCVVNGPGEMADADFGYVGGAPGKVNLYVGKQCVRRSIPSEEAVAELVELLKAEGAWVDPR